jgi:hypothetical protein
MTGKVPTGRRYRPMYTGHEGWLRPEQEQLDRMDHLDLPDRIHLNRVGLVCNHALEGEDEVVDCPSCIFDSRGCWCNACSAATA